MSDPVEEPLDKDLYIDGYLKSNYDIVLNEVIPYNWDAIFIISGKEGAGKTTFSTQGCLYLDSNFNLNNVAFLPEQFERIIEEASPESAILWDEAITGINAANWASSVSQSIISKLTQIRKKKLKIFLCFPYLHMINKYLISRCVGSMYIYSKGFTKRGYGLFFNQDQTERLYAIMKEKYKMTPMRAYNKVRAGFYFRFSKRFCLPLIDYDNAKDEARNKSPDNDQGKVTTIVKSLALHHCKNCKAPILQKEIAKVLGITPQYVSQILKQ